MPGELVAINVQEGDIIEQGDNLATLSAMKMEMVVTAPLSGKIEKVYVAQGTKVLGDDLLFDIK